MDDTTSGVRKQRLKKDLVEFSVLSAEFIAATLNIMPYRSISDNLKHAAIRLYDRQILPMTDILDAVGFSRPTLFRVLKQYRETGHVSKPKSLYCGRLRALNYGDVHHLLEVQGPLTQIHVLGMIPSEQW